MNECEEESRRLFLTDFTKLFSSQQSTKTVVKFIITNRREKDIEKSLTAVHPAIRNLQVNSGKINNNLSTFIDVKVDKLRYHSRIKEKIKYALREKAGGTFLYVSLVLNDLNRKVLLSLIKKKLRELPSDLNKLYDKILSQIDVECVKIARSMLR